jgi:hypothetical protein
MARVPVQAHDFDPATAVCIHCHVPKHNVATSLGAIEMKPIACIWRWTDQAVSAEPRRTVSAADDFEMIGARAAQLRAERDAILAQTTSVE